MLRAFALVVIVAGSAAAATSGSVTFTKDVLPILQRNCQGCHRPGEVGPMPLETYQQARPWAKAIKDAVLERKMPPWFADPHFGKFANDRSLRQADAETLVAWADHGAREGDGKDAPPPAHFVDGWNIGRPDVVYEMPTAYEIPASGTIDYQYLVIPTGFTQDKWIQMAEVRPGNRAVVHHVIAFIRPPGSHWLTDARPGIPFSPKASGHRGGEGRGGIRDTELLVGFAPGLQPTVLKAGQAKLVKAGSDIVLQLHYTANGKAATDQTKIGVVFARAAPTERIVTMNASNSKFIIPPGDADYEVQSQVTFDEDVTLVEMMPHMHLRGKDFLYKVVYPTGESETLLSVPDYSFSWQLGYTLAQPLAIPKGTRMECTAHFDNSLNNTANPNPNKEVRWGDQSWEEMMIGWFDVAIDAHADPGNILRTAPARAAAEPAKGAPESSLQPGKQSARSVLRAATEN
ncbi:MAG: cytochrome c [Bryobacteraceae bacterium]